MAGRRRAAARRLGDAAAGAAFAADGGGVPVRAGGPGPGAGRVSPRLRGALPGRRGARGRQGPVHVRRAGRVLRRAGGVACRRVRTIWPALAGAVLSPGRARRSWVWRTALDVAAQIAAPRPCRVGGAGARARTVTVRQRGGLGMSRPDPVLVTELTRSVQDALVADATARVQSGRARLGRGGQEALADKVLRQELQRIDTERLSTGTPRLTADEERTLVERVLALSVGLGPVELLLADESVEEVVAYPVRPGVRLPVRRLGRAARRAAVGDRGGDGVVAGASGPHRGADRAPVQRPGPAAGDAPRRRACAWRRRGTCPSTCRSRCAATRSARSPWPISSGWAPCPRRSAELLAACMRSSEMRLVFSGPTGSGKSTLVRACLAELGAAGAGGDHRGHRRVGLLRPARCTRTSSRGRRGWPTTRARARSPRASRSSTPCGTGRTGWCSARSATPTRRCRC